MAGFWTEWKAEQIIRLGFNDWLDLAIFGIKGMCGPVMWLMKCIIGHIRDKILSLIVKYERLWNIVSSPLGTNTAIEIVYFMVQVPQHNLQADTNTCKIPSPYPF